MHRQVGIATLIVGLGCSSQSDVAPAHPDGSVGPGSPPSASFEAVGHPEAPAGASTEPKDTGPPAPQSDTRAGSNSGEAADGSTPMPFPTLYCATTDVVAGRWRIDIDPAGDQEARAADRLAEAYPDADGVRGRLSRSNIPRTWRDLRDVTLVNSQFSVATSVRSTGVRMFASGGAFTFVLDTKFDASTIDGAVAFEGHPTPAPGPLRVIEGRPRIDDQRWARVQSSLREYVHTHRPRAGRPSIEGRWVKWIAADLGGGIEGVMIFNARRAPGEFPSWAVIAGNDGSDTVIPIPVYEGGAQSGPAGFTDEAFYEVWAVSDLDRDGRDELLIHEHWIEGLYTWLVRYDDATGALTAELLCGDAL